MKPIGVQPITTNRRITLPKDVTDRLDLQQSDYVTFYESNGEIYIKKTEA